MSAKASNKGSRPKKTALGVSRSSTERVGQKTTTPRRSASTSGSRSAKRASSLAPTAAAEPAPEIKPLSTSAASLLAMIVPELPGRLFVDSNVWPELGVDVLIKLQHGWYHGYLVELGSSVLIGGEGNFIRCRVTISDPQYPVQEPLEPTEDYACLEWGRAMWATTRELNELIRTKRGTYEMMERAKRLGLEYIVGVAIRRKGVVYRLGWPARHYTILHMLSQTLGANEKLLSHEQGFWTSVDERYVSREEAAVLARAAGQTVSQRSSLFSEDLW